MVGKLKITTLSLVLLIVVGYYWLQPQKAADETLFYGGIILTMEPGTPKVEAILVRSGRIIKTGALVEVEAAAIAPERIDLENNVLMPGFIEPHTHPLASAVLGAATDISGFNHTNRADVMESLKAGIQDGGINGWILAAGWDPVMLQDLTPPTLAELDALSPDKPLVILTQMMHDAYANSLALEAAGITNSSRAPKGGEFVRDKEGNLTGTIREIPALAVLLNALPGAPKGAHEFLLAQQYKTYAKAGYTTLGILGPLGRTKSPVETIKTVAQYKEAAVRTLIYALPEQLEQKRTPEHQDSPAPVIGVKFWMDGSPFAGGAAFEAPYENNPLTNDRLHLKHNHLGALNHDASEFASQFEDYHKRGFQIAVHTQGERAIDRVLDTIDQTLAKHPRPDHRHRLEHNALITKRQLERAHKLGVTTSFFVNHIYYYGHALPHLVGTRTERYMPIKTALSAGHKATVHTDNPASPIEALQAMQTLRMRQSRFGGATLAPDQKLSPIEALEAMTINAAWQLGIEQNTGSLREGKSADFVVLSNNPLETADADLLKIEILGTWLKGQPVDTRAINITSVSLGTELIKNFIN